VGEPLPSAGTEAVLGFAPSWLVAKQTGGCRLHRLFSPAFAAEFGNREAFRVFLDTIDVSGQLRGRPRVVQAMYLWSKTVLPVYLLNLLGDRSEMAHSVEGRLPFLDHRLVEFARSVPMSMKIRGLTEKYILREAAKLELTEAVYRRQKHPFMTPPSTFRPDQKLHVYLQDTLRGGSLQRLPFFDRAKVLRLLDDLPTMDDRARALFDHALMTILSACVLQSRFGL